MSESRLPLVCGPQNSTNAALYYSSFPQKISTASYPFQDCWSRRQFFCDIKQNSSHLRLWKKVLVLSENGTVLMPPAITPGFVTKNMHVLLRIFWHRYFRLLNGSYRFWEAIGITGNWRAVQLAYPSVHESATNTLQQSQISGMPPLIRCCWENERRINSCHLN